MSTSNFRGLRLDVAVALKGRRRTLYETAKALGRRSGDIQRLVRQMHADGLLDASSPEPTRGTLYWLAPQHYEALDVFLESTQPAGQLASGQRVLRLRARDPRRLYGVLEQIDLSAAISWAAECANGRWLVGLSPDATKLEADQLLYELQGAGFKCQQEILGAVLPGDQLRRMATSIMERERRKTPKALAAIEVDD